MKEPKFRIWDKSNKVFFYIDFADNYLRAENASRVSDECMPHLVGLPRGIMKETCQSFSFFFMHRDNYIWQQFTGLKDINNKDIYDGDILEDDNGIGYVYYNNGCFWVDDMWLYDLAHCNKVVGNVFENPDLK